MGEGGNGEGSLETALEKKCSVAREAPEGEERGENSKSISNEADDRSKIRNSTVNGAEKKGDKAQPIKYCRYYRWGQCAFGDRCRYSHDKPPRTYRSTRKGNTDSKTNGKSEKKAEEKTVDEPTAANVASTSTGPSDDSIKRPPPVQPTMPRRIFGPGMFRPRILFSKEHLGTPVQRDARQKEIAYFQRRFPGAKTRNLEGDVVKIEYIYSITEPDWPFDVRSLNSVLSFPAGYPIERAQLKLAEAFLPPTLVIHIEKEAEKFFESKHSFFETKNAYEVVGRLLIRWFDRSILDLFIDGLKKTKMVAEAESAGISLVMPASSSAVADVEDQPKSQSDKDHANEETGENCSEASDDECNDQEDSANEEIFDKDEPVNILNDGEESVLKKPKELIEVRVNWNNTSGNIASLSTSSLTFQIRCVKCSATGFMTCCENQLSASYCKQCKNRQSILLEPAIVHEFSNVIAFLEPRGCRPVDCVLLSSSVGFVCLACNTTAVAENLSYGSPHKTWCHGCHAKCEFSVLSIRFFGNFQSIATEDQSLKKLELKKKKVERQTVIAEGGPLPDYGTCKHYRKSYRWFRFPCCGKVYPCDLCHNAVETEHEMKLANRIVCGFCSKEQPFQANKPCMSCKNSVVNTRTAFWEGGKGCRDRARMNRNDRRKFIGSPAKTESKKHAAQKEKEKQK